MGTAIVQRKRQFEGILEAKQLLVGESFPDKRLPRLPVEQDFRVFTAGNVKEEILVGLPLGPRMTAGVTGQVVSYIGGQEGNRLTSTSALEQQKSDVSDLRFQDLP